MARISPPLPLVACGDRSPGDKPPCSGRPQRGGAAPRHRQALGALSSGLAWPAQGLPRGDASFELLMVSGGDGVDAAARNGALLRWLQRAARARQRRITSVCSGSLLLAAAGLLDGRAATTHWSRTHQFGLGAGERMRRAFHRLLGQPPAALKRAVADCP